MKGIIKDLENAGLTVIVFRDADNVLAAKIEGMEMETYGRDMDDLEVGIAEMLVSLAVFQIKHDIENKIIED